MSSDKLNKKAREAADQYDESYSESAWQKMEQLLDKHMPLHESYAPPNAKNKYQKWLFLLLGLSSLVILFILFKPFVPDKSLTDNIPAVSKNRTDDPVEKNDHQNILEDTDENAKYLIPDSRSNPGKSITSVEKTKNSFLNGAGSQKKYNTIIRKNIPTPTSENTGLIEKTGEEFEYSEDQLKEQSPSTGVAIISETIPGFSNQQILVSPSYGEQLRNSMTELAISDADPATKLNLPAPLLKTKSKKLFAESFAFTLSAGPDVSAVGLQKIGRIEIGYGMGLSYNINNRWQLRSGYYMAHKIYDAAPKDYSPPPNFWNYYPHLESIHANCIVHEIPLIVNYNFKNTGSSQWFGAAGISSYFMKKETYDYVSRTYSGQYQTKRYIIKNENKHYFSSVRLSAGYVKHFNNKLFVIAEPYMNLPLSGVGYGKVNLSGGGILLSLGLKPFAKK
ncbi:hypothetical protein BH20BAC1_BH20BAC1_12580 [soil metagenome]